MKYTSGANKFIETIVCVIFLMTFTFVCADKIYSQDKPPGIYSEKKDSIPVSEEELKNAKARDLKEVIVTKKHQKYSKKNNPAVDLMQRIRKDKESHNPEREPYYSFDKYDKMVLAFNEFDVDLTMPSGKWKNKVRFFSNYVDTAAWTGKRILDLSLKEKYSVVLSGEKRGKRKEIITGLRSNGLDEGFNQDNIRYVLEDVFREIDVYDNDITLMQNRFVSPLSSIGADYYKYEITDTVVVGGEDCVELSFYPHNPESFSFNGKLFIPVADSVKYVKRVSMRIPKAINLNYIEGLYISQNFTRDSLGNTHKTLDDISVEFKILPNIPKLFTSRQTRYDNFSYDSMPLYDEYEGMSGEVIIKEGAEKRSAEYWETVRMLPLSSAQSKIGDMMSRFRSVPLFYWAEKVLNVLVNGYITTGNPSKFDIGPMNTTLSYNTVEGMRFRVGGITTPALSRRWFGRGYVAYGLRDRKLKYKGEVEYSFIDKKYSSREFPLNSIRATYQYDTDQLGQHYLFTNSDNVFLSLKRKSSDLVTYRRLAQLEYNLELKNNLSFGVELRHEVQEATPWVPFITGTGIEVNKFTQAVGKIRIRYAPGEKFVQGMTTRMPINMDAPVIMLTHEFGPKGFLGSDFTLNKTELSAQKRIWFSSFGYSDIVLKGGIIWSKVEFPALLWQNANLSYTIQPESYSLLNPMEFAMDKYMSLDFTYFMNGLIFNRIPLVKKLKLREVFTFKGFMGSLSDKNNPYLNNELFRFPTDSYTMPIGRKPYMEIGAGIDNIFSILRVDYVWRLTYRDNPGIDKSGLRISLHFSF